MYIQNQKSRSGISGSVISFYLLFFVLISFTVHNFLFAVHIGQSPVCSSSSLPFLSGHIHKLPAC